MKKKKIQWRELIGEIVGELVITLVFFGIGALVLGWFGIGIDAENVDGDLICLIGVLVMCLIVALCTLVYRLIKRKKDDKKQEYSLTNQ